MKVATVGTDLAKNLFQLHGVDESGRAMARKRLSRGWLLGYLANLELCLIDIDVCAGVHYSAWKMRKLGNAVCGS